MQQDINKNRTKQLILIIRCWYKIRNSKRKNAEEEEEEKEKQI
jgi:hypothetical protein